MWALWIELPISKAARAGTSWVFVLAPIIVLLNDLHEDSYHFKYPVHYFSAAKHLAESTSGKAGVCSGSKSGGPSWCRHSRALTVAAKGQVTLCLPTVTETRSEMNTGVRLTFSFSLTNLSGSSASGTVPVHNQGGSSLLSQTPSQTHPEVPFLGNSKSSLTNHHTRWYIFKIPKPQLTQMSTGILQLTLVFSSDLEPFKFCVQDDPKSIKVRIETHKRWRRNWNVAK